MLTLLISFFLQYGTPTLIATQNKNPDTFCDPDKSGRVDGFDLGLIGRAFNKKVGDPDWEKYKHADCNDDGAVDKKDLEFLERNFGKTLPKREDIKKRNDVSKKEEK